MHKYEGVRIYLHLAAIKFVHYFQLVSSITSLFITQPIYFHPQSASACHVRSPSSLVSLTLNPKAFLAHCHQLFWALVVPWYDTFLCQLVYILFHLQVVCEMLAFISLIYFPFIILCGALLKAIAESTIHCIFTQNYISLNSNNTRYYTAVIHTIT